MTTIPGYFIAPDTHGVPCIWAERGEIPRCVKSRDDFRDDRALWDLLTANIRALENCVVCGFTRRWCPCGEGA